MADCQAKPRSTGPRNEPDAEAGAGPAAASSGLLASAVTEDPRSLRRPDRNRRDGSDRALVPSSHRSHRLDRRPAPALNCQQSRAQPLQRFQQPVGKIGCGLVKLQVKTGLLAPTSAMAYSTEADVGFVHEEIRAEARQRSRRLGRSWQRLRPRPDGPRNSQMHRP